MILNSIPNLPDLDLHFVRKVEWNLLTNTDDINEIEEFSFSEIKSGKGLKLERSNKGVHFTRESTNCLALDHESSFFPSEGFGIGITFRLENVANPNGETILKSWLFKEEKEKYFEGKNYATGVNFALGLNKNRQLIFIVCPPEGFKERCEVVSKEVLRPNINYFAFAQYDPRNVRVVLVVAPQNEPLSFNSKTWNKTIAQYRLPLIIGCQELGREKDSEFMRGWLTKVGIYLPLNQQEITRLAWEYGVYPYGTSGPNFLDGYIQIDSDILHFPLLRTTALPRLTDLDFLKTHKYALVKAFINHWDVLLNIYAWSKQGYVKTQIQEVINRAKRSNHAVLNTCKGKLTLTLFNLESNKAIDYSDRDCFIGQFTLTNENIEGLTLL